MAPNGYTTALRGSGNDISVQTMHNVRMSFIVGVTGEKGSGKDTFISLLSEVARGKSVKSVNFSQILRETLDAWGIPCTRANLQTLPVIMDKAYGVGTLSNAVYARALKVDADIVVLTGVRWPTDVELVRRFPKNRLVYVTASPRVRYERLHARGENVGEKETLFEQFMQEEQAANEVGIPILGASADYKMKNETTVEAFREAVEKFYRQMQ